VVKITLSPIVTRRLLQAALAISALMVVDIFYQLGMHMTWRLWIARQARALHATAATQPAQAAKNDKPPELAAAIRNRNLFTAPRPPGHGLSLTGVIGNIALFASREGGTVGIKEGESAREVKVKSINQYEVVIEYQGKPETMRLFGDQRGGAPAMGGPPGPVPASMSLPPGVDISQLPPDVRARIERRMRERGP
jgi:hypothetical protein